jgi:hypothetical protein
MEKSGILRIAAQMVVEFGDAALAVANSRVREFVQQGTEAAASWLKIVATIEELIPSVPNGNEHLH